MLKIPLAQVKNQLSELLNRVEQGEVIAVTRRGKPIAKLTMYVESDQPDQQVRVQEAFSRLQTLSQGLTLNGDVKSIAREGLA